MSVGGFPKGSGSTSIQKLSADEYLGIRLPPKSDKGVKSLQEAEASLRSHLRSEEKVQLGFYEDAFFTYISVMSSQHSFLVGRRARTDVLDRERAFALQV